MTQLAKSSNQMQRDLSLLREKENELSLIRERIARQKQTHIRERAQFIGQSVISALNEGYLDPRIFAAFISRYIPKKEEIVNFQADFDLDSKYFLAPISRRGRRPRDLRGSDSTLPAPGTVSFIEDIKALGLLPDESVSPSEAPADKDEINQSSTAEQTTEKASSSPVKRRQSRRKITLEKQLSKAQVAEQKAAERAATMAATEDDEGYDDFEDNSPQGNVWDTKLSLDKIRQFRENGRLVDRLSTLNIDSLGDITNKTEDQFAATRGLNNGIVKTVKRILGEMGTNFRDQRQTTH